MKNLNLTEIAITVAPPTPTPGSQKPLSYSDKIALGVGIAFGVPGIITSFLGFYYQRLSIIAGIRGVSHAAP
jgi:hypothetical protein